MTDKTGIDTTKPGEILEYMGRPCKVIHVLSDTSKSCIVEFLDGERKGSEATSTYKRLEGV